MNRSNIILTGFMGSGKTTVGRLLARELKYDFVDTDQLIEERCGKTIHKIFKTQGENAFRVMEEEIAGELGNLEGLVISTGGGLVLNRKNLEAVTTNGCVFCLIATPQEILQRISADNGAMRPLLESPNPLERIVALIKERKKSYEKFPQIKTSGKSPQKVMQDLISLLSK